MISTRYLIVGGGMTGDAAVRGIRDHDPHGAILLVGAEQHPPYARPPLTKKLWFGGAEAKIWRGTAETGADLRRGRRIVSLDLEARTATDDAGEQYGWERLLLATGAARGRSWAASVSSTSGHSTTTGRYELARTKVRALS
jgi:3-phenylpropionate/trans-cinnamate dioxygenase ferredoxin reductase component